MKPEAAWLVYRRAAVASLLAAAVTPSHPACAFENRLPQDELELKYKSPRTAGPKPTAIGIRPGGTLQPCTDGKPHCFSSSPEVFEDNDLYNADYGTTEGWLVAPFKFDKSLSEALEDVKTVVAGYPPGQRGIDGGGFKLITASAANDEAYVYVQFESRRRGYVDDFEMALKGGVAHVRTSSRLGYLDIGVNAKRWNYFADELGKVSGWKTTPVRSKGHEEYFSLNRVSDQDMLFSVGDMVVKADKVKL